MAARNFTALKTLTALSGSVTNVATTIPVVATTNFPTAPFTAVINRGLADEEVVLVTAVAALNLTVTRAYDGTAGVAHTAPATFEHCTTALDETEANTHINATTNIHGSSGALIDVATAQTMTKTKTIQPSDGALALALRSRLTGAGGQTGDLLEAYDVSGSLQMIIGPTGIVNSATDIQANSRSMGRGWLSNGYAQIVATSATNAGATLGTAVAVTGMAITVAVLSTRRYRISVNCAPTSPNAADQVQVSIFDSTNSAVLMTSGRIVLTTASANYQCFLGHVFVPGASGTVTYQTRIAKITGTATGNLNVAAAATQPAYILIEDLGPAT